MEFRILGPLEVWARGERVRVGGSRQHTILAMLLLEAGRVVPLTRLIDAVWGDRPPSTAKEQIQNGVSALRRTFLGVGASAPVIVNRLPGYVLSTGNVDAQTFIERADYARAEALAGRSAEAVAQARAGLRLWRGAALCGIGSRIVQDGAARLDEHRLAVLEDCIERELSQGLHHEAVRELSVIVAEHPLRERFRAQLMIALYRSGRRIEALQAYRGGRKVLMEEFGLEPCAELRRLEQAILAGDPALDGRPGVRVSGSALG